MEAPDIDPFSLLVYLTAKNGLFDAKQTGKTDELVMTIVETLQRLGSHPLDNTGSAVMRLVTLSDTENIKTDATTLITAIQAELDRLATQPIDWSRYDPQQKVTADRLRAAATEIRQLKKERDTANDALTAARAKLDELEKARSRRIELYKLLGAGASLVTDKTKKTQIQEAVHQLQELDARKSGRR